MSPKSSSGKRAMFTSKKGGVFTGLAQLTSTLSQLDQADRQKQLTDSQLRTLEIAEETRRLGHERAKLEAEREALKRCDPEHWFGDGSDMPYVPGPIYDQHVPNAYIPLGKNRKDGADVGIMTEGSKATIADTGAGKGVASQYRTARYWPHEFCLAIIDPSGGITKASIRDRAAAGHFVGLIDPFDEVKGCDEFRISLNPIGHVSPDLNGWYPFLDAFAEGMIKRHDPRHGLWDNNAKKIIMALTALMASHPELDLSLPMLKHLVSRPFEEWVGKPEVTGKGGKIKEPGKPGMIEWLRALDGFEAVGDDAVATLQDKLGQDFLSNANSNTAWLNDPDILPALEDSGVTLHDLVKKPFSLYFVLPQNKVGTHSGFLKLFVMMLLYELEGRGEGGGPPCLLMIDEAYSIGHINRLSQAASTVRKYATSIWTFWTNFAQMRKLMGDDEAQALLGVCGLVEVFGVDDIATNEFISRWIGDNPITGQRYIYPSQLPSLVCKEPGEKLTRRKLIITKQHPRVSTIIPTPTFPKRDGQ